MNRIIVSIFIVVAILAGCSKKMSSSSSDMMKATARKDLYEYYYVEGLRNKLVGSPGDAIGLFEQCIQIDPERDGAYYQIGQIAYVTGNLKTSVTYGQKALERNNNLWHYMLVGNSYYLDGKADSAILVYERAVSDYPDQDELKYTLGNICFDIGKYDKAYEIFSYFDEKYGLSGSSAIPLIRSLIEMNRIEEAEEKLGLLIEEYPDKPEFLGLLAELYRDSGQREKAAKAYSQLIGSGPDDIRTLFSIAEYLRQVKSYGDLFGLLNSVAIRDSITEEDKVSLFATFLDDKEIIKNYPKEFEMSLIILEATHKNSSLVSVLMPELYILTERKIEAVEMLERMIVIWPESYYAWEKLLLLYSEQTDYEKLYSVSTAAIRRFNTALLPRLLNSIASVEIGFYDEALGQLSKVRGLSDGNSDLLLQVMSIEADALYRKGDVNEAFLKYDEALMLSPDDPVILNNYAYFLAERGERLREAKKMIERVIEGDSDNNTFNDTYGWVLYKQKKYRKAETVIRAIVNSEDNSSAEYFEHYGYILKALKRCEEAVMAWKRAIEIDDSKIDLNNEIDICIGGGR